MDCTEKSTKIIHKNAIFQNRKIKNIWWNFMRIDGAFCSNWNLDKKSSVKHNRKAKDAIGKLFVTKEMTLRKAGKGEGGNPWNLGKKVQKKAWQRTPTVVKYPHISEHAHQPMLLTSIAQGKPNFNRNFWNWYFLQAKCPVNGRKWCCFCSRYIRTERFSAKFEVFRNRIFWMNRLLSWLLIKGSVFKGLDLFGKF